MRWKKVTSPSDEHTSAGFAYPEKMNKESTNECHYGNQRTADTLPPDNRLQHFSKSSDCSLLQPGESMEQSEAMWAVSTRPSSETATCSQYRGQSLEKLFLDLESVQLSKEDEDSASDLSDSERVPIPPSPLTPPKLNLRAEEIKPGYFSQYGEHKGKDYEYADVLPPPHSSWSLHQVSTYVHKEGKTALQSPASAPLEKYVDRLRQLEWLQMQTIQSEKAKVVKSRPHVVPVTCRNGKSPGKYKPWPSPSPSKYISTSDNVTKTSAGQDKNHHKKYAHHEHHCGAIQKSYSKLSTMAQTPTSAPKQTQDVRCKKKSVTNYQQTREGSFSDSKMQCSGNIRPQRQMFVSGSAESTPKQAKPSKIRKSELSVSSRATNRHCVSEQKK